MKKNNKLKQAIRKEKIELSLIYVLSFLLIFLILGFAETILTNNIFFKSVKDEMNHLKIQVSEELVRDDNVDAYYLPKKVNMEARVNLFLYKEDYETVPAYYTSGIMSYFIPEYQEYYMGHSSQIGINDDRYAEMKDKVTVALTSDFFDLDDDNLDKFVLEKVITNDNYYYFYTLSFEVKNSANNQIKYGKLAMMVNGEIASERQITKVYYLCALFMFLLATIVAITLAMRAIKPIELALEKEQEFVGDASHELRTPLSIIQSKLENILTRSDEKIIDVSDDIAISLNEISRLNKLVKELLTLSKDDKGGTNVSLQPLNIFELIKNVAIPFEEMADIDSKPFNINGEDIVCKVDEAMIKQLVIIILDNALKYTAQGDSISINVYKENNFVTVEVADTGIGINEETKEHIFERFYREDKARSRATGGNGLGMAIAKTIITQHKGKISVDHNKPKGTIVFFSIPLK